MRVSVTVPNQMGDVVQNIETKSSACSLISPDFSNFTCLCMEVHRDFESQTLLTVKILPQISWNENVLINAPFRSDVL